MFQAGALVEGLILGVIRLQGPLDESKSQDEAVLSPWEERGVTNSAWSC